MHTAYFEYALSAADYDTTHEENNNDHMQVEAVEKPSAVTEARYLLNIYAFGMKAIHAHATNWET